MIDAIAEILSGKLTQVPIADALEVECVKYKQEECQLVHHFGPGICVREVKIPAGVFAIGHKQKKDHLNIFLEGRLSMINDDGSVKEISAPMIFTGPPGRKAGYAHEDVVWLNIYPTDKRDVAEIEDEFVDKTDTWKDSNKSKLPRIIDREDYKRVLKEFGVSEELAREQSENELDQTSFPDGSYSVAVFPSNIEGLGLFATASFKDGEVIAPARIGDKRTPAGRYTNHAKRPNAEMVKTGNDIALVAQKDIGGCVGGYLGDEITVDYRKTLNKWCKK